MARELIMALGKNPSSSSRHQNKQSDVSRETSLNDESYPPKFEKKESY
jgi:hypothetical protein